MEPTEKNCVVDLEASGLSSESYPIEIGIILDNGQQYQALIQPFDEWQHWDADAEQLHGISRETLHRFGKPAQQVCREVNELCADRTIYSDCWVFDHAWLNLLFARAGVAPKFSCAPIEMILQEPQLRRFTYCKHRVADEYGIEQHRALNDALIIQKCLQHLLHGTKQPSACGLVNQLEHLLSTSQVRPSVSEPAPSSS